MENIEDREYLIELLLEGRNATFIIPFFLDEIDPEKTGTVISSEDFCQWLFENSSQRIFQKLLDVLKINNFEKQYKKLNHEEIKDGKLFEELIISRRNVLSKVPYKSLLEQMCTKSLINRTELNEFANTNKTMSNMMLVMKLITHISRNRDNWFAELIECLREMKEIEAWNILQPYLLSSEQNASLNIAIQNLTTADTSEDLCNSLSLSNNIEINKKLFRRINVFAPKLVNVDPKPLLNYFHEKKIFKFEEEKLIENTDSKIMEMIRILTVLVNKKDGCAHLVIALHENKKLEALDALGFNDCNFNGGIKEVKYFLKKVLDIDEGNEEFLLKRRHGDNLSIDSIKRICSEPRKNLDDAYEKYEDGKMITPSFISIDGACNNATEEFHSITGNECYDFREDNEITSTNNKGGKNLTTVCFTNCLINNKVDIEKSLNLKTEHTEASSDLNTICSSIDTSRAKESSNDPKISSPKETLQLRNYQKELAENALKGRNCLIVAPTGSGKTYVAMCIIQSHLTNRKDRHQKSKVVFMVPTVTLVEQQKTVFQKYFDQNIIGITGEDELCFSLMIDSSDIFVITPQILKNSLQKDSNLIKQLTLMIFDECHHAKKEHPYNAVMARYHKVLNENQEADLPQIVGLTASVGVGNATSVVEAQEYVLNICANLNTTYVCTVERYKDELEKHTNKPLQSIIIVDNRKLDPFKDAVNKEMGDIEKIIFKMSNEDLFSGLPESRGSDQYVQWISKLYKKICAIFDQRKRLKMQSYYEFLKIYNDSLFINSDCRTVDAVLYLDNYLSKYHYLPDSTKACNTFSLDLLSKWKKIKSLTSSSIHDPNCENPRLQKMKSILLENFGTSKDSRGIIFVKTREMTAALTKWINETEGLMHLKAEHLVGNNKSGQVNSEADQVLNKFRKGVCKLIVATSVAEEGLDIPKCDLVIRYNYVTNEISTVQLRGRARDFDSRTILIVERGSGLASKEETNLKLEELMNNTVLYIQTLEEKDRIAKIRDIQSSLMNERKLAEALKDLKISSKNENPYIIRCSKCDNLGALSEDVRKIEDAHHVVIDPDIKERSIVKKHPKPAVISILLSKVGKLYCKGCDYDWGIMALYKGVRVPLLKISSFVVQNSHTDEGTSYKKWKDVPFIVPPITDDELLKITGLYGEDNKNDNNDDGYVRNDQCNFINKPIQETLS